MLGFSNVYSCIIRHNREAIRLYGLIILVHIIMIITLCLDKKLAHVIDMHIYCSSNKLQKCPNICFGSTDRSTELIGSRHCNVGTFHRLQYSV